MNRPDTSISLATLADALVAFRFGDLLDGTEFGGGILTGPLLHSLEAGMVFAVGAFLTALFFPIIAVSLAVFGVILGFPLYLYSVVPGVFRAVFPGAYSTESLGFFAWDGWAVTGILLGVVTLALCVSKLSAHWPHR